MLVEDHELLAQSLGAALTAGGMEIVRPTTLAFGDVVDAALRCEPDIVLLDLRLAGDVSSLPMIAPLRELGASVVMVTGESDRVRLAECVEAGAIGLLSKSGTFDDLVAAVHEVAELRTLLTTGQRDDLLAELRRQRAADVERLAPFDALTPRERSVLAALMDGKPADVIAAEAFVSLATVRSQIRSVLSKLGVSSQLAAVAAARAARWAPGDSHAP